MNIGTILNTLFRPLCVLSIAILFFGSSTGQVFPVLPNSLGASFRADGGVHFCGTSIMMQQLLNASRVVSERQDIIEQNAYLFSNNKYKKGGGDPSDPILSIYTIPVVVHIIHNNGSENISDVMVIQGIQDLNDAFENIGAYLPSTGVDVGIEFCLAQRDENGDFTTGINRVQSTLTNMTMENDDITLKNLIRWDPTEYLNIWLIKEITSISMGSGVAGYAYFPSSHGNPEDGIVNEARWFGSSTDNSKVHIHEAGHYLGLYHTFEGSCTNNDCLADGDRICDTPPDGSTAPVSCGNTINTCTTDEDDVSVNNPFRPVSVGGMGDQDDMTIAYMDYGYQACQSAFTGGQRDRMVFMLTGVRSSLLASSGCLSPCTNPINTIFTASDTTVIVGSTVSFTNGSTGATAFEWIINGITFSTDSNTVYVFTIQGIYTIALITTNGDSACTDEYAITIIVTCPVNASFVPDTTSIFPGDSVTFTNTSSGASSYEWFLDGTSVGSTTDLTYTFNGIGGFMVYLVAYNGICYDTSAFVFIQVGNCTGKGSNFWYFGNYAGIDFNSGSPVAITNGALQAYEGSASISSESTGQLLFYTDGDSIWDSTHNAMPNGWGLNGDPWYSTQSALIVPWPGDTTQYFVFTASPYWDAPTNGIYYSVVDMTLNSGTGDVTTKNQPLLIPSTEKLTGVKHCNGVDYWVISHEWNTNNFYAWLVTNAGIIDTVVSSVGKAHTGDDWLAMGCLKASPDGKKLALAVMDFDTLYFVELLDFNASTGIVSNPIELPADPCPFGVSFSPNSSKLYISGYEWCTSELLYQFDISSGDSLTIAASMTIIDSLNIWYGLMQLAPDGKIYVSMDFEAYLGVINNPNASGISCNWVFNGFNLGGPTSSHGLPNFIESYFDDGNPEITGPDSICSISSNATYYTGEVSCSVDTVEWTVNGTATISSFTDTTVTIDFLGPGVDTLILRTTSFCNIKTDTLLIYVSNSIQSIDLGNDTAICTGSTIVFDAGSGFSGYEWQDGSTNQTDTATSVGTYWVEGTDSLGCTVTDTVNILAVNPPPPTVDLGNDTTVCGGSIVPLNAGSGYTSYQWQDNSSNQTFTVWLPGTYWVTITNACGVTASDSINVLFGANTLLNLGNDTTICDGAAITFTPDSGFVSYIWQDSSSASSYTTNLSGTYWVIATDSLGCTATDTVIVIQEASIISTDSISICSNQSVFLGGAFQNTSGTYFDSLTTVNGCDSFVTTVLEVNPAYYISDTLLQICEGDSALIYGTYTSTAGSYSNSLISSKGCDSISTTVLIVNPLPIANAGLDTTTSLGNPVQLSGSGGDTYSWQPPDFLSCNDCQFPDANPEYTITYYLTVYDSKGCTDIDSVIITVDTTVIVTVSYVLFVPDIFSPNGDDNNDIFYIHGEGIESLSLFIYDRWGEKVFENNGFIANQPSTGWDGRYKGEIMNPAVFVYFLTGQFTNGEAIKEVGDFTLIR